MVVGALGIDPELEQASRTVERTRYTAFPFQFPDVSQVASSAEMIRIRASAASTSSL
jgi:hypothetical protein